MEQAGRPQIDAALARDLVAAQFPQWADLPVRPVAHGGWDNRAFHLGEGMIVRLPSAQHYAAQAAKEQAWLARLAPHLPLEIPCPLGLGRPGPGFDRPWSILRWIPGETADRAADPSDAGLGRALGAFLAALQAIDASDGPAPGPHNFFRGGPLATYDEEVREALRRRADRSDAVAAERVWNAALGAEWSGPPVWVHGDVAPRNLLMRDGGLAAVIDFGGLGVGDPACDLAIAWSFLRGAGRSGFRAALPLDPGAWARGRGWALWKALILATGVARGPAADVEDAERVLGEVLAEPQASDQP
ncbi:MAG: aminoglycoside phosphotransferase family protein [Phenylobacterium sp.]|uniref:aminoglycoside phosphotransferase family protein n=1 Tax=Phenylobacterium sp. TaxID=1871053 RepID=UPI00391C830B